MFASCVGAPFPPAPPEPPFQPPTPRKCLIQSGGNLGGYMGQLQPLSLRSFALSLFLSRLFGLPSASPSSALQATIPARLGKPPRDDFLIRCAPFGAQSYTRLRYSLRRAFIRCCLAYARQRYRMPAFAVRSGRLLAKVLPSLFARATFRIASKAGNAQ